ncbi:MAG: hypothetical protein DBX47_05505 [Clostridiales bacterium]|nr:MAG: hypothetical protein DBX47_05505 [Clostridiales bacterium]
MIKKVTVLLLTLIFVISALTACGVYKRNFTTTDGDVRAYFVESSYKVEKRQTEIPDSSSSFEISMCKNENEGSQIIIRNDFGQIKNASITVSELSDNVGNIIPTDRIFVYRQRYINIFGYVKGSVDCPDALIPMEYDDLNLYTAEKGENLPYFIDVKTVDTDSAGVYSGKATITFDSGKIDIPLNVTVYDFSIPTEPMMSTVMAGPWDSNILYGNGIGSEMLFKELAEIKMSMTSYPNVNSSTPEKFVETVLPYANDERISIFYCPSYIQTIDPDGTVHFNTELFTRLINELRKNGIMDKAYWSYTDEPHSAYDLQVTRTFTKAIKTIAPEAHINVAMNHFVGELLPDGLETWALSWQATSDYNISLIKNAGNQVFRYGTEEFYIAGNNLIEGKTRFWTQLRQGITGYLQWAADNYRTYVTNVESPYYLCDENGKLIMRDFWKDPYVFIPIEDYPTYSAGGDSYLFYPGFENDGIVNRNMLVKTIRLFGVRDGIEDYSILSTRRNQINAQLESYGSDLSPDVFMANFYDSFNNIIDKNSGSLVSEFEKYSVQKKKLLEDIVADSNVLIGIERLSDNELFAKRSVTVIAPQDSKILINGNKTEQVGNKACTIVDVSNIESEIEISVNGVIYDYTVYPKYLYSQVPAININDVQKISDTNPRLNADTFSNNGDGLNVNLSGVFKSFTIKTNSILIPNGNFASCGTNLSVKLQNNSKETLEEFSIAWSSGINMGNLTSEVNLAPGESKTVYFDLAASGISYDNISKIVFTFENNANIKIFNIEMVMVI